GIVPIENSIEGVVTNTLDLFSEFSVKICGEVQLSISHCLLSKEKKLESIKHVYSHPHALPQCRTWLENHLPKATLTGVNSTSKAAQLASQKKGSAAIASEHAASIYGLHILRRRIEDYSNNFTRFVMIGKKETQATGQDKTSILFSVKDQPGILFRILKPLSEAKINLTKIESRPLKKRTWEYVFFIDLDGHIQEPKVKKAIEKMEKFCQYLQYLGSYPKEVGRPR
ncbi:MAG: prephenate dehydratase, partial [Deltaproteobacteria bacterium]|nr:prephenate dehydratase [Deltaproteobacteria bacterium]